VRLAPADDDSPETWPQVKAYEVPGMPLKKEASK